MHDIIKEIQALAQIGLRYSKDPYDLERYQRLRELSFQLFEKTSNTTLSQIQKFFFPEKGYATPKVDLRACVIQNDKVLLIKESSDGKWTLPGGWADQNEAPIEGVIREVKEESGFDISVKRLYAVKDRDRHPYIPKYPVSIYKLFFTADIVGGKAETSLESSEIHFFSLDNLPPLSLARVLIEDITLGFKYWNNNSLVVTCD